ncbi:MAG TPA: enolase C-terminal domain-like protein [Stellaceae bacterium]|nr:enolase C-terminal domain-like protein [Stellaceae bacterium]
MTARLAAYRLFRPAAPSGGPPHLWLELRDADGTCGYAPLAQAAADRVARSCRDQLAGGEADPPGSPSLALARLDLELRRLGVPLQAWLGAPEARRVPLARRFEASGSAEETLRMAREAVAAGYETLSLHGEGDEPDGLLALLPLLRSELGTGIALRLCLPGRLDPEQAAALLPRLRPLHLEGVFDPVGSVAAAERLPSGLPPIGLGAAIASPADLAIAARSDRVALAMLAPLQHGGVEGVRKLARIALVHQLELRLAAGFGTAWEIELAARLAIALPAVAGAIEPGHAPTPSVLRRGGIMPTDAPGLAAPPPLGGAFAAGPEGDRS